jgi:galactoside O-acetyltransferase
MSFLSYEDLCALNFATFGKNVRISKFASVYNAQNISIASNVRIDDFAILSAGAGGIRIGNFVHVGCHSSLVGDARIDLCDFSGLSGRVSIYSSNEDYSGNSLTNPTIPHKFRSVTNKPVIIGRHVIVGAGSVILPGVHLQTGGAVGALSLVTKSFQTRAIVAGQPAIKIGERTDEFLSLETKLLEK